MKKIYTLIAGLLLTGAASAQVNGGFESPMSQIIPGFYTTAGWNALFLSPETAAPAVGAQSGNLTTTVSAVVAQQTGFPSDTIPGYLTQGLNGTVVNPSALTVSLKYKYAPVNSDTAVFVIEIYDTLTASANDDVLLYQGLTIFTGATSTWTDRNVTNLTAVPGATGTPNQVYLLASSSIGGVFNGFVDPRPGSKLSLDEVKVNNLAFVGIEKNELTSSSVYPNPTSDVLNFNVTGTEATSIYIFGLDGKLVISQDVNGVAGSVNVSELKAGMYVYQIATTSGKSIKSTFFKN